MRLDDLNIIRNRESLEDRETIMFSEQNNKKDNR